MPVPSQATQNLLHDTKLRVDAAKQLHDDTADELEAMFPSILSYAFQGQIEAPDR
jgi:hypothetical protein